MIESLHIFGAISGLVFGALVFLNPKGTRKHKLFGYAYFVSLMLVNASALSVYEQSPQGGPFHILAVVSLLTLAAGMVPVLTKRPKHAWLNLHAYFMSWSYVGLIGAGVGQLGAATLDGSPAIAVFFPTVFVVLIGGLLIHSRTQKTLEPLLLRRG